MDLFLAITQGIGVSVAAGVRAFLPALLVGVLARANLGIDFGGTDYSFLESAGWLAAIFAALVLVTLAQRRGLAVPAFLVAAAAVVIAALEFAGTLADDGYAAGPGLAAGAACAVVGFAAAQSFFERAAARVRGTESAGAASLLELYAEGFALALAGLAVLIPPVSLLALALCVWVLAVRRRRASAKYEGLRILR